MSNWKVIKTKIEVFPHSGADKLQLGKVGTYQVVVQKGLYNGGEDVVFAPEKSVLTNALEREYKNYLAGTDKNRVKAVFLRGELSCGIIIPDELVFEQCGKHISELPLDEDLSGVLGIVKYEAPIPVDLEGKIGRIEESPYAGKHDCEQLGVYASNFVDGERVVVTEKVHGTQLVVHKNLHTGKRFVSSKGLMDKELCFLEDVGGIYWGGADAIDVFDRIDREFAGLAEMHMKEVQVFAEVFPAQKGDWKYGQEAVTARVFDVRVDGQSVPYDQLSCMRDVWVPVLYDGPYSEAVRELRAGKEQVSGKETHIREGVVIRPYVDRRATDGTRLVVKSINPSYRETGEEIS